MLVSVLLYAAYKSDANKVAHIHTSVKGFSLNNPNVQPVLGRAIVIHNSAGQRVGCGLIEPLNGEVVTFSQYPNYAGTSKVMGLLAMQSLTGGALSVKGTLSGLAANANGGWHVHTGVTCGPVTLGTVGDVIGGHYFPGMASDPWDTIKYTANAEGVAVIDTSTGVGIGPQQPHPPPSPPPVAGAGNASSVATGAVSGGISGFSLYETNPVAGHAVVVHDEQGGARAGCGVIGARFSRHQLSFSILGNYPGSVLTVRGVAATVGGTLIMEYLHDSEMVAVRGVITGLNASTTGGWHIHAGFSCEAASLVGGHYYLDNQPDTWMGITYTSDSYGVAKVETYLPAFSLMGGPLAVNGHAVVVHNSFGSRIGCGVITPASDSATVMMGGYPGVQSQTGGVLVIQGDSGSSSAPGGLRISGTLTGLPRDAAAGGGWHIHSGFTCEQTAFAASGVFGHYFEGLASDPWTSVTYGATDSMGVVQITETPVSGFSLTGQRPVDLRSVVVHDPNSPSNRIGCGTISALDDTTTHSLVQSSAGGFGLGGFSVAGNIVAALQLQLQAANADFLDVAVLWIRTAHWLLVGVVTAVIVIALNVLMFPGSAMAIGLGYLWTYAYGGVIGISLGTLTFWIATLIGCLLCYALGSLHTCKGGLHKIKAPACLMGLLEAFEGHPMKLMILLRSSPIVPYNVLNYYVGASGRFTMKHVVVGHIFTAPMSFMFIGVGGAIVTLRMVLRGEASPDYFLPFIITGLSVAGSLFIIEGIAFVIFSRRTVKKFKARPPPGPSPKQQVEMDQIDLKAAGAYVPMESPGPPSGPPPDDLEEDMPPPPPPPPMDDELDLQDGWRPVLSDDGETYYFNDETGDSQWDPPLKQ